MKKYKIYLYAILLFGGAIFLVNFDGAKGAEILSDPVMWVVAAIFLFLGISYAAVDKAFKAVRVYSLKKEGKVEELAKLEAEELAAENAEDDDAFTRFWQKLQGLRPIEEEGELEMDHQYDGIRELDNNLPPWWLWGFYLSIVFAVIYLARYHVFQTAPTPLEELKQELAEAEIQKAEYLKTAANLVDENSVTLLTDAGKLAEGGKIYQASCAVCHAADGGGGVGPNFTDEYWLHGGSIRDVFSTVKYGVPAKGMISWKDQLNPSQMQQVSSFILTFQGTEPLNPKEPQGEIYSAPLETLDTVMTDSEAISDTVLDKSEADSTLVPE